MPALRTPTLGDSALSSYTADAWSDLSWESSSSLVRSESSRSVAKLRSSLSHQTRPLSIARANRKRAGAHQAKPFELSLDVLDQLEQLDLLVSDRAVVVSLLCRLAELDESLMRHVTLLDEFGDE